MSSVYLNEPPTSGKVILTTNFGNIDIELWTKETPRACRNFIQLCMDGYFNNCVFFRIIKGFMIQTGDPSNTGKGGQSIWNKEFQDEFHSRLRFRYRGMLAMANRNVPNSNSSQFFITLDKCPWLDKKHTIFGKVAGDTYFNALNISELPTKDDYPITETLPMIMKADVIINPFSDIVPRVKKKTENISNADMAMQEKIRKSVKEYERNEKKNDSNLISFDDDESNQTMGSGIKSVHEMITNDPKLINKPIVMKAEISAVKNTLDGCSQIKENVKAIQEGKDINKNKKSKSKSSDSESDSESISDTEANQMIDLTDDNQKRILESLEDERKNEILKLKNDIIQIKKRLENPNEILNAESTDKKSNTPLQKHVEKFLHLKKGRIGTKDAIEKLNKFREKLKQVKNERTNWMNNKLKFHVDSQKAYAIDSAKEYEKRNMRMGNEGE